MLTKRLKTVGAHLLAIFACLIMVIPFLFDCDQFLQNKG